MTIRRLRDALQEVSVWFQSADRILLGLDFDGTLAPIRPRPDEAVLPDSTRKVLASLAARERIDTMIVSGRSLDDVSRRVGLPGLIYSGNHGLEINGCGLTFVEERAAASIERLARLSVQLASSLSAIPCALVEAKGLTTSVHYRNVPNVLWSQVAQVVERVLEHDFEQFELCSGNRVWEVRPRVNWHKGDAVMWALNRLGTRGETRVFFLGDDRTDEDVFSTFPSEVTVKVGPEPEPTLARFSVADPGEVCEFLGWLDRLESRRVPMAESW